MLLGHFGGPFFCSLVNDRLPLGKGGVRRILGGQIGLADDDTTVHDRRKTAPDVRPNRLPQDDVASAYRRGRETA